VGTRSKALGAPNFKGITALLIVVVLVVAGGCDAERLDQFSSFAAAGSQYVEALHKVIADAGSAMIASDSATLLIARQQAAAGDPEAVRQNDKLLAAYLENLQKIDGHATLLGSYFAAISNLTNSKTATDTSASAAALLDSIDKINPQIEKITFGGVGVKDFVQVGTGIVVARFQVKALDEHLRKAAPIIDKALSLQEAAVNAIASQMKAALGTSLEVRETTDVIQPYVKGPPASWNANRESFLRAKVTIDSVDHAKNAISQLRVAFKQLVESRDAKIDLPSLLREINKMVAYARALESSAPDWGGKQP
jgi:hypothetical protein